MKGGKAIASGSAGCVFKPALLCEGDTDRKKDYITKVMYNYNAEAELKEIKARLGKIDQKMSLNADFDGDLLKRKFKKLERRVKDLEEGEE